MEDRSGIPSTMAEALSSEDPYEALLALSHSSEQKAQKLSDDLAEDLSLACFWMELPSVLQASKSEEHPVSTAIACADSILNSLSKIASGGSQASQEIRQLEHEKSVLETHAQDVETALALRKASDTAAASLNANKHKEAARAVQAYVQQLDWDRITDRARAYAGEYTLQQMESTQQVLRATLLEKYQLAADQANLQLLGDLTPLLQMVQLEKEAVAIYLRYLQVHLNKQLENNNEPPTPHFIKMAAIYNCGVATLRHHLPMLSHCLYKADGDAAVVQLVHVQVEHAVVPLLHSYTTDRQLPRTARNAQRIYSLLEQRYSGQTTMDDDDHGKDDCGFSKDVGPLADVDAAMEETALCLQHAESYSRFLHHTVAEVNKAREIRHKAAQHQSRMERERQEWATMSGPKRSTTEHQDTPYSNLEILPAHTQLHEVVTELGGYYSVIERCLLLASMQRAFVAPHNDPNYYSPLDIQGHSSTVASQALQTSLVEACFFAARRATNRAFCTGHTGTASAMTNFCADCLGGVLMEVMSRRAEEAGVAMLKPGEGLLVGSGGIFNASNLIRQGTNVSHAVVGGAVVGHSTLDEATRKRNMDEGIARACATLNDMEIAIQHTQQLEQLLEQAIDTGFPPNTHDTEQLRMCVKSLTPVSESFQAASEEALESLVSVLKPRIRSIVGDSIGSDGASSFMSSSVMGGGKTTDRAMVRLFYDLDEDKYQLLQLGEGYIARMCSLLDELINPLRLRLAPRLSDALVLEVLGTAAKRLEASLRRCHFSSLGALALDSDMRDLLSYAKSRLDSPDLTNNMALYRACIPLARLLQIAKLLTVDDLDDVLDLISASKRKNNWDLKLEDAKAFLSLRNEFEASAVNELLRMDDD